MKCVEKVTDRYLNMYIDTLIGLSVVVNKPFITNLSLVTITFSSILESVFKCLFLVMCALKQTEAVHV